MSTDQRVEPPEGPDTLAADDGRRAGLDRRTPAPRFAAGARLRARAGRALLACSTCRSTRRSSPSTVREAEAHAGPDYGIVTLARATAPEEWVDEFALLNTRMSTDAPLGGLDLEEDVWDARAGPRRPRSSSRNAGLELLVLAAEHVPDAHARRVHGLHGGAQHRRVRAPARHARAQGAPRQAARDAGQDGEPAASRGGAAGVRRIGTWNAEENSYMLAINVALGFRPAGGAGEWQLKLSLTRDAVRDRLRPPAAPPLRHLPERDVVEAVRRQDRVDGAVRRGVRGGRLHEHEVHLGDPVQPQPDLQRRHVVERAAQQRAVGPASLHVAADGHAADADEPGAVEQPVAALARGSPNTDSVRRSWSGWTVTREPQLVHERDPALVDLVADAVERWPSPWWLRRVTVRRVWRGSCTADRSGERVVVRPGERVDALVADDVLRLDRSVDEDGWISASSPSWSQPNQRCTRSGSRRYGQTVASGTGMSIDTISRSSSVIAITSVLDRSPDASDRSPGGPRARSVERRGPRARRAPPPSSTTSPDGPPAADRARAR